MLHENEDNFISSVDCLVMDRNTYEKVELFKETLQELIFYSFC